MNLYAYVYNDAVNRVDPTGQEGACVVIDGCRTFGQTDPAEAAGVVADYTPIVSDFKAAVEAYQDPNFGNVAAAIVGVVPGVGDIAGKVIKGAYKIITKSKKWYVGKGPPSRMRRSVKETETKANSAVESAEHMPSTPNTDEQALMDEAQLIRDSGGIDDPNSLNKINSPGEKKLPPTDCKTTGKCPK